MPTIPGIVTDLQLIRTEPFNATSSRLHFELTCTRHCAIHIGPAQGVTLGRFSLFEVLEENGLTFHNPRMYLVTLMNLFIENRPTTDFWLDINHPTTVSGKRIDVGVVAHYTEERDAYSPAFQEFLDVFPDWTTTTDWISSYTYYEF